MGYLVNLLGLVLLVSATQGFRWLNGPIRSILLQCTENNVKHFEKVPEATGKTRVDVYLSTVLPSRSRSFIGDLCDKGLVAVNDRKVTKSFKLSGGDVVSFHVEEREVSKLDPENIPLDILYEDDDIIAVNKPQGMVVHPAPGSPNATFVNALLFHLGPAAERLVESAAQIAVEVGEVDDEDEEVEMFSSAADLPETPEAAVASHTSLRPGVVHRLDKGTSGVLIAGKHPEAVAKLSALFAARKVSKVYLAICVGHPGDATIVNPIGRSKKNRQMMAVCEAPLGKPAVTHVKTLAFDGKLSVALVRIETGRTHQIRVHLKERRTPIAGDETYGNADWNKKLLRTDGVRRPLLHAYETQFLHPFTGNLVTLRAPLPLDMAHLMGKLSPSPALPLLSPNRLLLQAGLVLAPAEDQAGTNRAKGFVPLDRIRLQDDQEWNDFDLPEIEEDLPISNNPRRKI